MDMVYNAHADADRRGPRAQNVLTKVLNYVIDEELDRVNRGDLDRRDRIDFLNWSIEWFTKFVPVPESQEALEKQGAVERLQFQRDSLLEDEIRMRIIRHEVFERYLEE
jgi:hypothetical protein